MNKTNATIQAYLHRGNQLWNRAAESYGLTTTEMPANNYIEWLIKLLPVLRPTSRRQYLAASKEYLLMRREIAKTSLHICIVLDAAIQKLMLVQASDYNSINEIVKTWRGKTSNQKAKRISINELGELAKYAKSIKGKWMKPAMLWMTANLIVGLRPCEWRSAYIEQSEGHTIMVIKNAKNTNGRSHGELRHIELSQLKREELCLVMLQLNATKLFATNDVEWNKYYLGVRKAIYKITRGLLPAKRKYATLYTSRHQFAADAKSSGMSKVEVAALMGHATDETATMHYGKKKHGKGHCRVKATVADISAVHAKTEIKINQLQQQNKI